MRRTWIRLLAGALAVAVALLAGLQVVVPGVIEDRIEDRLTERGGTAEVAIDAFPAIGLILGGDADSIEVRGSGIPVDLLSDRDNAFDRLDDFDDVDVRLTSLTAGPVDAGMLSLERNGHGESYRLDLEAEVKPAEVARFAGEQLGGPLGSLAGGLAGDLLPFADRALPVEIEVALRSEGDGVRIVAGGGSVAGLPLGPLATLVVEAVAERI